jgi:hypothetical protein
LTLATVGVAAGTHFEEIANHGLKNCAKTCEKKD